MPNTVPSEIIELARTIAAAHTLDPALVCAVIEQESAWNPWAVRYEPGFLSRYVARSTPLAS
jgi:soluble lytic murein transglycosylase-like protein